MMNKSEFLKELDKLLFKLPKNERERSIEFYSEMIDDRIEDGSSEENAVSNIGTPQSVAEEILRENSQVNSRKKYKITPWTIVFAVLASPIWLPILVAIISVILSVYVTIWAVVASIGAVGIGTAVSSFGSIIAAILMLFAKPIQDAIFLFGSALILAGISIFIFFAFICSVKATVKITVWSFNKINLMFFKGGKQS